MKYEILDSFKGDWDRLSEHERRLVRVVLPAFGDACDRFAAEPSTAWPASLRVKDVEGAPGIFEMTWSFKGPAGRATFEWVTIDGALGLRWRRIGGHAIFRKP